MHDPPAHAGGLYAGIKALSVSDGICSASDGICSARYRTVTCRSTREVAVDLLST